MCNKWNDNVTQHPDLEPPGLLLSVEEGQQFWSKVFIWLVGCSLFKGNWWFMPCLRDMILCPSIH